VTDLSDLSPTEMIAEAERRTARRAAGLPLEDESPKTAAYVHVIEGSFRGLRRVTLPWSVLVPDGERFAAGVRRRSDGKYRAILVMTLRYRKAKAAARKLLQSDYGNVPPLTGRVRVAATLYEPNASRIRDVSNFAKLVNDAMTGIIYVDDGQIDEMHWQRGAPDIDRPRLEISVTEIGK
jgi:Holliday junction resolvase RusA-like endonuclease